MADNMMTPADIAAIAGNGGMEGNGSWWIILFLIFAMFGGGFGGFGNRGGELNQWATAAGQNELLLGQKFDALGTKVNQIGDGICSSTYALNNAINGAQSNLGAMITAEGRAMQQNCCDLKTAIHAEGEATRALIQQNKIESLEARINELQMQTQLAGVVKYPMASTFSMANPYCGCGC